AVRGGGIRRRHRQAHRCPEVPGPGAGLLPTARDGRIVMEGPARILVVDDTDQNRRLMDAVLSPHGYTVLGASSGPEALERIAAEPVDLVLLDIVMPEMSGYDVCR